MFLARAKMTDIGEILTAYICSEDTRSIAEWLMTDLMGDRDIIYLKGVPTLVNKDTNGFEIISGTWWTTTVALTRNKKLTLRELERNKHAVCNTEAIQSCYIQTKDMIVHKLLGFYTDGLPKLIEMFPDVTKAWADARTWMGDLVQVAPIPLIGPRTREVADFPFATSVEDVTHFHVEYPRRFTNSRAECHRIIQQPAVPGPMQSLTDLATGSRGTSSGSPHRSGATAQHHHLGIDPATANAIFGTPQTLTDQQIELERRRGVTWQGASNMRPPLPPSMLPGPSGLTGLGSPRPNRGRSPAGGGTSVTPVTITPVASDSAQYGSRGRTVTRVRGRSRGGASRGGAEKRSRSQDEEQESAAQKRRAEDEDIDVVDGAELITSGDDIASNETEQDTSNEQENSNEQEGLDETDGQLLIRPAAGLAIVTAGESSMDVNTSDTTDSDKENLPRDGSHSPSPAAPAVQEEDEIIVDYVKEGHKKLCRTITLSSSSGSEANRSNVDADIDQPGTSQQGREATTNPLPRPALGGIRPVPPPPTPETSGTSGSSTDSIGQVTPRYWHGSIVMVPVDMEINPPSPGEQQHIDDWHQLHQLNNQLNYTKTSKIDHSGQVTFIGDFPVTQRLSAAATSTSPILAGITTDDDPPEDDEIFVPFTQEEEDTPEEIADMTSALRIKKEQDSNQDLEESENTESGLNDGLSLDSMIRLMGQSDNEDGDAGQKPPGHQGDAGTIDPGLSRPAGV